MKVRNLIAGSLERTSHDICSKLFYCIDPPYFSKGSALYTNFYKPKDHVKVASTILNLEHPWMLTYDNNPAIRDLYISHRQNLFNLNYSAQEKRIASELLITSHGLELNKELNLMSVG